MKTFNEVASVIQVGTQRATLPSVDFLPETGGEKPEKRALVLAGTLELMRRAGVVGIDSVKPLPTAPQENRRVAEASEASLSEALDKKMTPVVLEWAEKAKQLRAVLPPALLTAILPLVKRHREELLPVIGKRGLWLAQLQGLDLSPSEDEKLAAKRTEDPAAYREWLTAEYEAMDWKSRRKALEKLKLGICVLDEPLLEKAMSDRQKDVRECASNLLLSQPYFRAARELALLARQAVKWHKSFLSKSLTIDLPESTALPKWLPRSIWRADLGLKSLALFDLVRSLPPASWETEGSPTQFLQHVIKTDHAQAMLEGLQIAAMRFEDVAWIDAMLELAFSDSDVKFGRDSQLVIGASEAVFDRVMLKSLSPNGVNRSIAMAALELRKRPFSLALTVAIIEAVRSRENDQYLIRVVGHLLHPDAVFRDYDPTSCTESFGKSLEKLRTELHLRKRLLSSLDSLA